MTARLCGAFLLSGAAALLFETLWFRLSGLALGNSVWASTAVLASFMAGLALGNLVAARRGERVRRSLRLYAALEAGVALGLGLVLGLPGLAEGLGPVAIAERDYAAAARFFEDAGSAGVGFHSPVLLRGVALGLAGRMTEVLALAESLSPADLPPHARPWKDRLIERLRSVPGPLRPGPPAQKP